MARDAVVIGAGIPGLLAAWRLAQGGMDAVVLERGTAGSESSALAAGHVPQESTSPHNLAVLRRTKAIVEELDRAAGGMVRFHEVGGLQLAAGAEGAEAFRVRAEQAAGLGAAGELLTPDSISARWPDLHTDGLTAGYYTAGDGFVRSSNLAAVLGESARQAGAEIWEGCPAERITVGGGRVTGVETRGGEVSARRVLAAAGAWSGPLLARSGLALPAKSFVLQAVTLADAGRCGRLPFLSEFEAGHYVMPRSPGALLLGLPPTGIDADVERFCRRPDLEAAARYVRLLRRRVPALEKARPAGGWAGVLTSTPDAWPLLGRFGPEGLYMATAFGGGGVQRVAAAEAVAQLMLEEEPFYDVCAQEARRFDGYDGEPFEFREGPFYFGEGRTAQLW